MTVHSRKYACFVLINARIYSPGLVWEAWEYLQGDSQ